uniref:tape measure protein n=1 Tax=Jeotgalibaca porci TaxID=1868793 RepID=UPI0035A0D806
MDGRVVIEVELNTNKARSQYAGFGNEIANDLGKVDQASKKASVSVMSIAKAIGLVKVAGAVFNTLKNSMDAAISRFDTFQRFPKVMDALGFSTEQSDKSIRQLSDGIDGLPTKLDDVVSTTQRMTAMTGNLSKSTQATLALNNAFLASGASASDAQRGTEQYIQQLAKGEVDLQSWRTLQESMSVGLTQTAHAMGFVGEAATTDLYDALKSGKVTLRDFQEQLIKLGTGTGELAKLAKINSEGIGTSFSNLRNTASKGLANVIDALNDLSLAVTKKSIAQNIDNMKVMINKSFDSITNAIRKSEPVVRLFIVSLDGTYRAVKFLSPA